MLVLTSAAGPLLTAVLLLTGLFSGCFTSNPPEREAAQEIADPERPGPVKVPASDDTLDTFPELEGTYLPAEIATVGFDRVTAAPIVLLRELGSGQVVPIWVGAAEARAIALALHEIDFPRPLTHDLMTKLISKMGGTLDEVVVHDLVDGTYYGLLKVRVEGRDEPLLVDTRPSDGLALAARTGAAIAISQKILDESPDFEFMAPQESDQVVRLSGLTLVTPTPQHRDAFGLADREGVLITRATGVAERQGLKRGDLILTIGDEPLEAPVDFLEALDETPVGEPLKLRIFRRGEESEIDFVPDRRSPEEERDEGPTHVA